MDARLDGGLANVESIDDFDAQSWVQYNFSGRANNIQPLDSGLSLSLVDP